MTTMPQDLPPLTLDDMMAATGKNRRNMQEIVRQYILITGDHVEYYKRRNFLEMRFSEQQRDDILAAMQYATEKRISYADAFRERLTGGQPVVPFRLTREEWDAQVERLAVLETSLQSLHEKVDAFQRSLEAAINPG